ncbi:hypothetical protein CBM2629_A50337 [Cupriavidus taiwanensis]|nr:hypothetical protein CBM2629_A50337 [Cupriavidus taiwanensis]
MRAARLSLPGGSSRAASMPIGEVTVVAGPLPRYNRASLKTSHCTWPICFLPLPPT